MAVSVFPGEQYPAPRRWTEEAYPDLIYYNEVDKGGHFAAWEQPEPFARRSAQRSLRCAIKKVVMGTSVATPVEIRPFTFEIPEGQVEDLRRRIAATRLPTQELVQTDPRACSWRRSGNSLATGRTTTTSPAGDTPERATAVHDRDRRGRDPLHPRQVAARERVAADHDARMASLVVELLETVGR